MESYIEITFLNDLLLCVLAYYASAFFSLSKVHAPSFFLLLIVEQVFHVICFNASLYFLFYGYEIFFYFYIFRKQIKKGIMYFCLKYLLMFTCFKFLGGSFHLLHYYVPTYIRVYGLWLVLFLLIVLLKEKWSAYLRVSDFIYEVKIKGDEWIKVKGFLDTGNNVCMHNVPVLFLDESYASFFLKQSCEKIKYETINCREVVDAYLCEVQIEGYKKEWYYISCSKKILLEWNCKCILNVEI